MKKILFIACLLSFGVFHCSDEDSFQFDLDFPSYVDSLVDNEDEAIVGIERNRHDAAALLMQRHWKSYKLHRQHLEKEAALKIQKHWEQHERYKITAMIVYDVISAAADKGERSIQFKIDRDAQAALQQAQIEEARQKEIRKREKNKLKKARQKQRARDAKAQADAEEIYLTQEAQEVEKEREEQEAFEAVLEQLGNKKTLDMVLILDHLHLIKSILTDNLDTGEYSINDAIDAVQKSFQPFEGNMNDLVAVSKLFFDPLKEFETSGTFAELDACQSVSKEHKSTLKKIVGKLMYPII